MSAPFEGEHVFGSTYEAMDGKFTGRRMARIQSSSGRRVAELHLVKGALSRLDGPAFRVFRLDGTLSEESFYVDGRRHRVGAPAREFFDAEGRPSGDGEWLRRGNHHRLSGPAIHVASTEHAVSPMTEWWFDSSRYFSRDEMFYRIRENREESNLRASLVETEFADLLADPDLDIEKVFSAFAAGVCTATGMREVIGGAPVEWVLSWEAGSTDPETIGTSLR